MASSTGKPLYLFDVGDGAVPWWRLAHNYRYKPMSHHLAMALGPRRMRRDVGRIQTALVDSGQAEWLAEDSRYRSVDEVTVSVCQDELAATAAKVRRLLKSD